MRCVNAMALDMPALYLSTICGRGTYIFSVVRPHCGLQACNFDPCTAASLVVTAVVQWPAYSLMHRCMINLRYEVSGNESPRLEFWLSRLSANCELSLSRFAVKASALM